MTSPTRGMRIAVVKDNRCNPLKCALECIKNCPVNREGDPCISLTANKKLAVIDEQLCTGCGICINVCPFGAISIINLDRDKGQLLHQYSKNGFRIFRIPRPEKGQVVRLLGRNGVGKSTALEILAGLWIPNLGDYENPPDKEDIIRGFRGRGVQNYLKDLFSGNIRASYKPQQVDEIPRLFRGTVSDLLKKTRELERQDDLIDKFE